MGGAGAVLLALSSWLGKVWASRILEREKAELSKSIESTRAELTRAIEQEKALMVAFQDEHRAQMEELSSQRLDALNRRRDVYARLATKLRIFLRADVPQNRLEEDRRAFLAAYDEGYIWSSEPVAAAILELVETMVRMAEVLPKAKATPPDAPEYAQIQEAARVLDAEAQERYRVCLLAMRRDCGFPVSTVPYRVVGF